MELQEANYKQRVEDQSTIFPATPNVYLCISTCCKGKFNDVIDLRRYKLDLEREQPVLLNWQSSSPYLKNLLFHDDCHLLGDDKIFRFSHSKTSSDPHIFHVFGKTSNQWLGFSPAEVGLPREMDGFPGHVSFATDRGNNRILIRLEDKGLYAFYPSSFKWEYICPANYTTTKFESSVVINNVLFGCYKFQGGMANVYEAYGCYPSHVDYGYVLEAMDVEDGSKSLKIVWPSGFDYDQFFRESAMLGPFDLGDGRLCLVAQFDKILHPFGYESDEYYYCSRDVDVLREDEKRKFTPMVTCMILEVEKQPAPPQPTHGSIRTKTKLLVKKVSRFDFKFGDDHVCSCDRNYFDACFSVNVAVTFH